MSTADDIKEILDNEELLKEKTKMIFQEKDIDKSNFLDLSEIKNLMDEFCKEIGIKPYSIEEVNDTLKYFDTNKDNRISLQELFKLIRQLLSTKYLTNS
ncbi:EF-hand domain-containing protein [Desulfococcaceae bacterium HSG7]|nr:EF-hand domain-containing protein [Desulfococcaceae bacterium HSG9]MDM8555849.1 EF-hand domain-containing protein [Desulfococcaceae bacterium HSG7]